MISILYLFLLLIDNELFNLIAYLEIMFRLLCS